MDDLVQRYLDRLREALEANDITLPSLGRDPQVPLISLGRCNADTARKLAAALRKAAEK